MIHDAGIMAEAERRGLAYILLNDFMNPPAAANAVNVNHIPGVYAAMTHLMETRLVRRVSCAMRRE